MTKTARVAASTPAEGRALGERGTVAQRARVRLVDLVSIIASRLPEAPLVRFAELGGDLWYRRSPTRAAQARRNLRRVVANLAERGLGGDDVRAAAEDPRALERLVRQAFRHQARYYLDIARAPAIKHGRVLDERVLVETPDAVEEAFARPGPLIFISLHFGAIELPGFYLARRSGREVIAPMETIGDPPLQRWFVRTRSAFRIRIVGLREARRELAAALARGETVGLVADRDITGGGIEVPLFGAPAPMPIGPAMLALESGAPIYCAAVRRLPNQRYAGKLIPVPTGSEGSRRDRITATLVAQAAAFERVIADAPEQWWAVFFPIWPDLEAQAVEAGAPAEGDAT
jgi:KDO2-lipid IV(A) lauroyltransferase